MSGSSFIELRSSKASSHSPPAVQAVMAVLKLKTSADLGFAVFRAPVSWFQLRDRFETMVHSSDSASSQRAASPSAAINAPRRCK